MVTGAGKKKFTDILKEKTEGCEIINEGDDTFFTLTQETPESPIYGFESQLIVTPQTLIKSRINRDTYWRTPRSILQDKGTNPMEKNMIRYLSEKEGLEV